MKFPFTLIFIFCITQGFTQNYLQHFSHISNQNGLANNIVTDIVQDEEGYVWIGTAAGLQRYDGKNFITYKNHRDNPRSIPSNIVIKLLIAEDGVLWIVTSNGVCYFDKNSHSFLSVNTPFNFLNIADVSSFIQDLRGVLWLAVKSAGIYFYDHTSKEFKPYSRRWPAYAVDPSFIQQDKKSGEYWLNAGESVAKFDPTQAVYKPVNLNSILTSLTRHEQRVSTVDAFVLDRNNTLWINVTTESQKSLTLAHTLADDKWKIIAGTSNHVIHSFLTTKNGKTWAASDSLLKFDGSARWRGIDSRGESSYSISSKAEFISTIFEDRDGSIWLGTDNGIFVFTPNDQSFSYTNDDILASDKFQLKRDSLHVRNFQIAEVLDSLIVIGSESQGLRLYSPKFESVSRLPKITAAFTKGNNGVSALIADKSGVIWTGGNNGTITHIDLVKRDVRIAKLPSIANQKVTALAKDKLNLWIGSAGGKVIKWSLTDEKEQNGYDLNTTKSFRSGPILKVLSDADHNCAWVMTKHQLFKIIDHPDSAAESIAIPNGLSITQLHDWQMESLLIGTSQGLFLMDKKTLALQPLTTEVGVFSYFIAGVVIDEFQNIWVATKGNGLFRISYSLKEVRRYGSNEGVIYSNFLPSVNLRTSRDRIVFGTTRGILSFDPTQTPTPLFNPRVKIISFRVNDEEYLQNEKDRLAKEPIDLDWRQNTISVEFSALSYAYKDQVSFSYMLEGQDRQWIATNYSELIKYSSLKPGSYTFRVRCKPATGEVVSDEVMQSFVIVPPFWDTWWFKILVPVFLIGIVIAVYRIRIQRLLLVQGIKNKISQDLHDHIGSSLSSMSIMLKVAENSISKDKEQTATLITKVSETAQATQENLHDIVWSIDAGKNSIQHIIDRMREFMSSVFDGRGINTRLTISPELEKARMRLDKRYNLYLIFKEIVNNGAKYSQATHVTVEIIHRKNIVQLCYKDDGVGFEMSTLTLGNGLENMQVRAKSMGGKIDIISSPGAGTEINLDFPV